MASLAEWQNLINATNPNCPNCGRPLDIISHEDMKLEETGYIVDGYQHPQHLWARCAPCFHNWTMRDLGVEALIKRDEWVAKQMFSLPPDQAEDWPDTIGDGEL